MASLTSARARNRAGGGAGGVSSSTSQQQDADSYNHHDSPALNGENGDDDDDKKYHDKPYRSSRQPSLSSASPSTLHKKATPSYSNRPFGSSAHVPSASATPGGNGTSGWITSGTYVDKGKGKAGVGGGVAKAGNGPLRAYGGGLGSVGQGEFKLLVLIIALASVVRLWKLDRPSSVVFDEVHFGGFATKYIKQRFFMDVHPPLAKLMITFVAWFAGYRGNFDFKDIGKEYGPDHVPYIAMRLLPASLGVAVVPIAYLTLRSMGCRPATCLLASLLITFENGLITQSRLILLDSPLLFYTALTVFFWSGFCAEDARKAGSSCQGPFSRTWWSWLSMTGLCLGLTLSCKWVGLFTIATVGLATIEQLWQILGDTKVPMKTIGRHFVARAICLIGITVSVYMWWFWIHFLVLNKSGDGDGFMSSEFQHTLKGHGMPDTFADVALGSRISIRHLHTQGGYLHSHPHNYPGGSKQQQVTLYPHKDDNNDWIVLNETQQYGKDSDPSKHGPITYLADKMFIRLHHPSSGKKLHSHDVRPPVSEVDFQNEVSAYGFPDFEGDANDNFQVEIVPDETDRDRYAKKRVRALRTKFKLRHVLTGCYLFSHKVKLPDWGFDQQEVTCNKNPTKANSIWFVETNSHPLLDPKAEKVNYKRPSFFSKFAELQAVMWRTNAGLTDRHAYDSRPHQWPYLRRGINFWVKDHRQIYLLGNPVIWWLSSLSVLLYMATRGFIILREKRGYKDLHNTTVQFYDRLCGFLFLGWVMHYVPFFLMQRQLFLHHYLPALYFSILLFASVFDLATTTLRPQFRVQMAAIILIFALWAFQHWSPLVYAGKWTKQDCEDAKWLKNWDFSCNDFHKSYSDYDNVIMPTPSKPVVHVGSGAPPVEAETPSNAATTVEPAKDAFAIDDQDGQAAPQSEYMKAEMYEKASAAHAEAEKKEDAERAPGEAEKIRETEPTNVPGAELPAEIIEPLIKQEVQEEINNEAPVPLEEAAPTPSDDEKSDIPIASIADPEKKAGAEKVRLADLDAEAAREHREALEADNAEQEAAFENEAIPVPEEKPLIMPDPEQTEEPEPIVQLKKPLPKLKKPIVEDEEEDSRPILQDVVGKKVVAAAEAVKEAVKPKKEPIKRPIAMDPDELAAMEEREAYQRQQKLEEGRV